MKNLTQIKQSQSVKTVKKSELKKLKGGGTETTTILQPDIYDI